MNSTHQEIKRDPLEVSEEKHIKNAVIDLLHTNQEVTDTAIAEATGISIVRLEKHREAIDTMLSKLKKVRLPSSI